MKRCDDKWLREQIDEDILQAADDRERVLMESEELKDVHMPMEKLEDILREAERRETEAARGRATVGSAVQPDVDAKRSSVRLFGRKKLRVRIAVAAAVLLLAGFGIVGVGERIYSPEISEREQGGDTTVKVNTDETVESEYDEEEICQEIQEELGVLPVRFGYRPEGMVLDDCWIKSKETEAIVKYVYGKNQLHVYISKDIAKSSVSYEVDGVEITDVLVNSLGMEAVIYEYDDMDGNRYFQTSFKYLNTYYSIVGMMQQDEFKKILENIWIKNI
ncbi:MAG: DUF4367 domain-containing protein [Eubacteriales bacterium]|nr:DUF4367 domain-containing protein [Eubacteriales bacterium]